MENGVHLQVLVLIYDTLYIAGFLQAVTLEVRERNSTCIKAELSAVFSITYNTSSSPVRTAADTHFPLLTDSFELPPNIHSDSQSIPCLPSENCAGSAAQHHHRRPSKQLMWLSCRHAGASGNVWIWTCPGAELLNQRKSLRHGCPDAAVQPQRLLHLRRGQQLW